MTHAADPRVSIVTRTSNRADLLRRAAGSVRRQTLATVEWIIVDDSEDPSATAEIVAGLPAAFADRVTLVTRIGETHGRWSAANAGVRAARGEYITLHDDDDFWAPSFLETVVSYLDHTTEAAAACTRTNIVIERPGADGQLVKTDEYAFLPELSGISLMDMLRANRIPPISLVYRRSLHDEVGLYDERLPVMGDWDFYLRVILAHRIDLLEGPPLAFWSHRPEAQGDARNSISAGLVRAATDERIRENHIRPALHDGARSNAVHLAHEMHWLDGRATRRTDELREAIGALTTRVQDQTRQIEELRLELHALDDHLRKATGPLTALSRALRRIRPGRSRQG